MKTKNNKLKYYSNYLSFAGLLLCTSILFGNYACLSMEETKDEKSTPKRLRVDSECLSSVSEAESQTKKQRRDKGENINDFLIQNQQEEFARQQNIFFERIEQEIPITENRWAVSLLLQPEAKKFGLTFVGHTVLAFIGRNQDRSPVFWAAEFGPDLEASDPTSYLRATACVNKGHIKTFDNDKDRALFMNSLNNFGSWQYNAWEVSKEVAVQMQEKINIEKQDPEQYNLFGHNTLAAFCPKYTYNCSGWAFRQVKECGINISGTLFRQFTGIFIPNLEWFFAYK